MYDINIIYEIKISKDCLIHETEVNKHIIKQNASKISLWNINTKV